ncbi:Glycoside hydrolase protein [Dioscorea alata]|uniref:Glycoside hydrolase protein n=1 Tax=Dioscorea alata TaxID=55571 RepID=A0ACB7VD80_DIOAL|nr:Glycoside hydrolase protein [Dioscorea alata]
MVTQTLTLILLLLTTTLHLSTAQTNIKGAYWFQESEFPVSSIDSSLFTHLFCAFANSTPPPINSPSPPPAPPSPPPSVNPTPPSSLFSPSEVATRQGPPSSPPWRDNPPPGKPSSTHQSILQEHKVSNIITCFYFKFYLIS